MNKYRRILAPAIIAICFVCIAAIAISLKAYNTDGYLPSVGELLFGTPICFFWILWFALVYYCANGIANEYRTLVSSARKEYPLVSDSRIKKLARIELAYSYSKKMLLVFVGLPLCVQITSFDNGLSDISLSSILILLIPFFVDMTACIVLWYKRAVFDV